MLVFQRSSLMTTNTPEVQNSVEFTHQTYVYYLPAHCTYCPSNQGEAAGSIEETLGNNEGVHRIIPSIRWNIDHFFSANFTLNKEGCIFGKLSLKALRESRMNHRYSRRELSNRAPHSLGVFPKSTRSSRILVTFPRELIQH